MKALEGKTLQLLRSKIGRIIATGIGIIAFPIVLLLLLVAIPAILLLIIIISLLPKGRKKTFNSFSFSTGNINRPQADDDSVLDIDAIVVDEDDSDSDSQQLDQGNYIFFKTSLGKNV